MIKALSLGAVLLVLYFIFSPYRNCLREFGDDEVGGCLRATPW